ncbi:orotate phosphoribosyltransferase [Ehrlichia chaffeensis str. Heartland]|uniref:Orotate phosphoribosyltransferase n=1 Tax=Ehrlichia chaffeensis (strain ATCC CRL-10679 / Arkansas) TaxID=205920 RepID=Q2GF91_EHRCR|nr:orotate phosphoribosyltransferase [Ehrlichia chaffeensis]ABD44544.1 orotate phosphoribosyltransferase [Ehrlichia chaffeensis str. Arkansas]AHX03250.1 orotate phosphoribosyltransferase [Ehrlichia chaffeensis str. Heartland]AHX05166.1 orotate phosphoribosyltransferase [Ehrlichia chaffeensis str. Jax]AHX06155.1 orotate phosphoribosyltransferase [Ehrlichia chaffeensis str. Liberty]AHX07447.1 orotate phosphoribosyltransferase [Ehrlichia chaffeensis str. Osceola]
MEADLLNSDSIYGEFTKIGVIISGHFVLSSGLHSDTYIQCARLFENPVIAVKFCALLATKIGKVLPNIDLIVSPAVGAITVGYEIARQLGINNVFCERVNGLFTLRRGFEIKKGSKVLIVEDVITTGKTSMEVVSCVKKNGGTVVAGAALVKRSRDIKLPFPIISLVELNIKSYVDEDVPEYLRKIPVSVPGSRYLQEN